MIGDRRVGPLELDDMVKEGVRPDTYVWCKGMADWMPASDVPDICRYFRMRLAGDLPAMRGNAPTEADRMAAEQAEQDAMISQLPPMAQRLIRQSGVKISKEDLPDLTRAPKHSKALPIILYIISLIILIIGFLLLP